MKSQADEKMKLRDVEILIAEGDITKTDTEAVINAANNEFCMGGGVAGAIKRAGGKIIEEEAMKKGPVKVGEAIITSAGNLLAKYVIHAVTMEMLACRQAGIFKTNEDIIRKATRNSLLCAQKNDIHSLAFCALGCGVGKFSYKFSAKIMAQEVFRYLKNEKNPSIEKIIFVLYSKKAFDIFKKNVFDYLGYLCDCMKRGPFLTVDGIIEYNEGIVLIERSNPPFGWALPGGFVDYGESLETAVVREVKEETNLDLINYNQFKVCSQPDRDKRFHTVSVVFIGVGNGILKAGSDAQSVKVFSLDKIPKKCAFDHKNILLAYKEYKNKKI